MGDISLQKRLVEQLVQIRKLRSDLDQLLLSTSEQQRKAEEGIVRSKTREERETRPTVGGMSVFRWRVVFSLIPGSTFRRWPVQNSIRACAASPEHGTGRCTWNYKYSTQTHVHQSFVQPAPERAPTLSRSTASTSNVSEVDPYGMALSHVRLSCHIGSVRGSWKKRRLGSDSRRLRNASKQHETG